MDYIKIFTALLRMVDKMSFIRFVMILLTFLGCVLLWQAPEIITALKQ